MNIGTLAMAAAVGMSLGSSARAAQTANATVLASVSTVLSVALSGAPANFNPVNAGSQTAGTAAIMATNDGSGVTETYQLSIVNPADWTSAASPGTNVFSMYGKFNVLATATGTFAAAHLLTTTPVISTAVQFAGDQDALNVPYNATRNLWLRFDAPTLTSFTAVQSITVVVTAQP